MLVKTGCSLLHITLVLFSIFVSANSLAAQHTQAFRQTLINQLQSYYATPDNQLNFAEIKVNIDKLIDPKIDVKATLSKLDNIAGTIQTMLKPNATSAEKVFGIKKYLYEQGAWNQYRIYQYDFNDPLGTKISNKLLSNYLITRKGNCISMPFLFLILANKLGVNITVSNAPLHVFVKYTDEQGKTYNLETTSGANVTRDVWYQEQMGITDKGMKSGIYLATLTKQETVAVMTMTLAAYYRTQKEYETVIEISGLALKYYPKNVTAMLQAGGSFYKILQRDYLSKYPNPNMIPANEKQRFKYLAGNNRGLFAQAEKLGWQEPPKNADEKYLDIIKSASNKNNKGE
jgi:regulator of sirC expression with transglutaminase-like and TPR domain